MEWQNNASVSAYVVAIQNVIKCHNQRKTLCGREERKMELREYIVMTSEPHPELMELVRCKDCVYWEREDGTPIDTDGFEWHGCSMPCGNETNSHHFCGVGQRREER